MTDLRGSVDVRGPGLPAEFVCAARVGSDVLAASGLAEGDVLRQAAAAVEFAVGMAEIHVGTAVGLDRAVFPLTRRAVAAARLERSPAPSVVVELA